MKDKRIENNKVYCMKVVSIHPELVDYPVKLKDNIILIDIGDDKTVEEKIRVQELVGAILNEIIERMAKYQGEHIFDEMSSLTYQVI